MGDFGLDGFYRFKAYPIGLEVGKERCEFAVLDGLFRQDEKRFVVDRHNEILIPLFEAVALLVFKRDGDLTFAGKRCRGHSVFHLFQTLTIA